MRKQKNFIWIFLGIAAWVVIFATLPLVLKNWDQVGKYNFEYEFLPIGVVPTIKSEYEATKSAWLESLTAENILISDLESGAVLLDKNSTTSAFPASTTKMLTAMVAKEVYDLDESLTVTKDALAEGNLLKYRVGEKLVAGDLIKALLINSSNESAEVLAQNYELGREKFVDLMNQKARDLNLRDSLFVNPAGFDQENIYSTARDLSVLAKELLKDEWLKAVVASKSAVIVEASGSAQHSLRNTNELLFELPEVKGVKTGTTDGAGQVLVALVEKNDRQILFVVMGSDDRYQDTKQMINWVDQAFDWVSVDFNNLIN